MFLHALQLLFILFLTACPSSAIFSNMVFSNCCSCCCSYTSRTSRILLAPPTGNKEIRLAREIALQARPTSAILARLPARLQPWFLLRLFRVLAPVATAHPHPKSSSRHPSTHRLQPPRRLLLKWSGNVTRLFSTSPVPRLTLELDCFSHMT